MTSSYLITRAYKVTNILAAGEPLDAGLGQDGLDTLNALLATWRQQRILKNVTTRTTFPMVAGKGGPDTPYTLGLGGDLNIPRIENAANFTGFSVLLNPGLINELELPRALLNDDQYEAIRVKRLPNVFQTWGYYNPTSPLGSLYLWPIPSDPTNNLVIYQAQSLGPFATLTTSFDLPDGYEAPVVYNLAMELAAQNGREVTPRQAQLATSTLNVLKRANLQIVDLPQDFAIDLRATYNILSGQ